MGAAEHPPPHILPEVEQQAHVAPVAGQENEVAVAAAAEALGGAAQEAVRHGLRHAPGLPPLHGLPLQQPHAHRQHLVPHGLPNDHDLALARHQVAELAVTRQSARLHFAPHLQNVHTLRDHGLQIKHPLKDAKHVGESNSQDPYYHEERISACAHDWPLISTRLTKE